MILYRSLHNIDLPNRTINTKRTFPDDFSSFVSEFVSFTTQSENNKMYRVVDENTQVIGCIRTIVEVMGRDLSVEEKIKQMDEQAFSIARKLLREEEVAQLQIEGTGRVIKKGSLVQALIRNGLGYLYVVAKVEHQEYFDGDSFLKSFGFPNEKRKIWKSAIIPFKVRGNRLAFEEVRVYTDNAAKYWAERFLELVEAKSDEYNTITVFKEVEKVLARKIRPVSERDYVLLRNTLIQTLKRPQQIEYNEFIENLVGNYEPDVDGLRMEPVRDILLKLPRTKQFDTQFTTVPSEIKARRSWKYAPIHGVELVLVGDVENLRESIVSKYDDAGNRYLKIICRDDKTFTAFLPKE